MKFTVIVIVSLMSFLLGCNHSLAAKREKPEVPIFLIKPKEMNAEEYVSELGRFYIMSDLIRDEDREYLAAIKMSDIDGEVPLIDLVRVFIYQNNCSGSPRYFMSYSRRDNTPALPQVFAVPKNTCVEVEMYRRKHDNGGRVYDEIKLADKFKIHIR